MTPDHPVGDPAELAALYAAGAMTDEQAAEFEAHLADCERCIAELRRLDPAVLELLQAVEPVIPDARVRDTLLARVSAAPASQAGTHAEGASPRGEWAALGPQVWKAWAADQAGGDLLIRRGGEGAWEPTGIAGIEVRRLFVDEERNQMTALVRMAAGTSYPRHLHNGPEECYVLQGDLHLGDTVLRAGDYQRAAPGSRHGVQSTSAGCLLLIVSSLTDELE